MPQEHEFSLTNQNLEQLVGKKLAEYRVSQQINNSSVFLAFKENSPEEQVAIKIFFPDPFACNEDIILERLQKITVLDHENVVKVHKVGQKDNYIYSVMEYVPGENLYDLMLRKPRLHWAAAAEFARDIVRGLVAAHSDGVLHLSLHPDRIMLGKGGQIKINFCNEGEITPSPEIVHYVAPELFLGQQLGQAADIYSLGAIIYNIVIGKPPLAGKAPRDVVSKFRKNSNVLPGYGVSDVPHALSMLLWRSLNTDPKERYDHCFELQAALHNFLLNDLGSYKLGSYRQLLPKVVEVSLTGQEFEKEVTFHIKQKELSDTEEVKLKEPVQPQEEVTNETPSQTLPIWLIAIWSFSILINLAVGYLTIN